MAQLYRNRWKLSVSSAFIWWQCYAMLLVLINDQIPNFPLITSYQELVYSLPWLLGIWNLRIVQCLLLASLKVDKVLMSWSPLKCPQTALCTLYSSMGELNPSQLWSSHLSENCRPVIVNSFQSEVTCGLLTHSCIIICCIIYICVGFCIVWV